MTSGERHYAERFDGLVPLPEPGELELAREHLRFTSERGAKDYARSEVGVSPRLARARRFIHLPDGTALLCADGPHLDSLPERERTERPVAWLEQRVWVAVLAVVLTVALAVAARFRGLPWAADAIAQRTSIESERALGRQTLARFDELVFTASELESGEMAPINEAFASLVGEAGGKRSGELHFRASKVGPNAFALPGGDIVLTDELVANCSTAEVKAVLAHELGHVERRHTLRQLIVASGTAALATAIFGDASSLSVAVTGAPAFLLELEYSRELESEADAFAFALLERQGASPADFADALACITAEEPDAS
jgi:Zn-dependent protease with chaperone function